MGVIALFDTMKTVLYDHRNNGAFCEYTRHTVGRLVAYQLGKQRFKHNIPFLTIDSC